MVVVEKTDRIPVAVSNRHSARRRAGNPSQHSPVPFPALSPSPSQMIAHSTAQRYLWPFQSVVLAVSKASCSSIQRGICWCRKTTRKDWNLAFSTSAEERSGTEKHLPAAVGLVRKNNSQRSFVWNTETVRAVRVAGTQKQRLGPRANTGAPETNSHALGHERGAGTNAQVRKFRCTLCPRIGLGTEAEACDGLHQAS